MTPKDQLPRISIIGLGKLGAPMAACLAAKGFTVIGVDVDESKVRRINALEPPVFEPGLAELLAETNGRLSATSDTAAVRDTDVTFVVTATPSDEAGGFSLRYALPVCEAIGRSIAGKDGYHLVGITSTVMPGATGGELREALERSSGRRVGTDLGLCYSPEFIALGSVIHDFLNPDFLLIGESDTRAGDTLAEIYAGACGPDVPTARTSFVNAEIAKLAVNTFITTKITYANTLARICERVPGADVDEVTSAIGLDSRIGRKYLKGAISYGGPCFPRDNLALAVFARSIGADASLAEATDRVNRAEIRRLADVAKGLLPDDGTVGVLGLAYKPGTDVVEESPGFLLVQTLEADGVDVVAYDPAAMGTAEKSGLINARLAGSVGKCLEEADVVVLATPWPDFAALAEQLGSREAGRALAVVDCWRMVDPRSLPAGVDYVALGRELPGVRVSD